MALPSYFPDPERSEKLIDDLLSRVKSLDGRAKARLQTLLEDEADLPMLDKLERKYRERVINTLSKITDRDSALQLGNALRSHFNKNLSQQRDYLHGRVQKALQDALAQDSGSIQLSTDQE